MLTSAYIDNELGNNGTTESLFNVDGLKLTQDDVYTYTFGAPNWGFKVEPSSVVSDQQVDDLWSSFHV